MNCNFKYIGTLLFCLLSLLFWSCADEIRMPGQSGDLDNELPVEFVLEWPGEHGTRAFNTQVKTKFSDQDVIHIVGTFQTKALQENGDSVDGVTARYGALRYDGKTRQWNAVEGSKLTWPSISTKGNFYAYYISNANGLIVDENTPITVKLSEVTPQTDPLGAPNTGDIVYGHAVNLQFQHLCSYLTLIDMEPLVSTQYFFSVPEGDGTETTFSNAYSLTLVQNEGDNDVALKGTPELKFEFIPLGDPTYDNKVFIAGDTSTMETAGENDESITVSTVSYFLQPGSYHKFNISYPASAPNTYPYLNYNYENVPPNSGGIDYDNTPPDLEAGTTYTLTITKSPGVTIVNPPSGEGWEEDEDSYDVEVKEFLKAVRESTNYTNQEGTQILEATPTGTKLLHNVTFKRENYEDYITELGFLPDILQGKVFDGNFHYIRDLGCPLFRYNYGSIINLGIKDVEINATSKEYTYNEEEDNNNTKDRSRHGALCMWNRSGAVTSNVRVIDVDMTINVEYNNEEDDGNEVHNIGGVFGSNTGSVSDLYLGGEFTIKVNGGDVQNAEILVGGITGQNAGNATINGVEMLDEDFSLSIKNYCQGSLGMYQIGGIAGKSSGFISSVILSDILVDSTQSSGVDSYLGGMVGSLDTSDNATGYLKDCIVSGSILAGETMSDNVIAGQAYSGGMVGYDNKTNVTGCRASVSVTGSTSVNPNVTYGTGGGFGRIAADATFQNLIIYGAKLISPGGLSPDGANYVGNFAGIAPASWEENFTPVNITFHAFVGLGTIGKYMD